MLRRPGLLARAACSAHAATRVEATDRRRLERLCRYVIRPPVAARRLRVIDDETLVFQLKTPWADGTTSLVLSPTELIEKLAALVPPRIYGPPTPTDLAIDQLSAWLEAPKLANCQFN